MAEILGNVPVIAVEFYRVRRSGGTPKKVTATPTVSRLTDTDGHGFIDLDVVESATPDTTTGFGRLLLTSTNDAQVAEAYGWTIQLEGETLTKTISVPTPTGSPRTVTIGGDTYPAVWLTDLATFTGPSGGTGGSGSTDLSNYFTKSETTTEANARAAAAVTAHTSAPDPHPQYALDAQAVPAGGSTGQVLTKSSGTDYAAGWQTPAAGGGSSTGAANRSLYLAMIGV